MAIPLATTTIAVRRLPAQNPNDWRDPTDEQPDRTVVATGVRAHISTSSGREAVQAGASQELVAFRLACDPIAVGLHHEDEVLDEVSGEVFQVVWTHARSALGLDHIEAALTQVSGVATGARDGR